MYVGVCDEFFHFLAVCKEAFHQTYSTFLRMNILGFPLPCLNNKADTALCQFLADPSSMQFEIDCIVKNFFAVSSLKILSGGESSFQILSVTTSF